MPGTIKVVIIGDLQSGKTELYRSMSGESFQANYKPTFGVDFRSIVKSVPTRARTDEVYTRIECWDGSGDKSGIPLRIFFSHASACLYCVDLSKDAIDEDEILNEILTIREHAPRTKIILVGTKADEAKGAQQAQLIDFAKRQELEVHVTSAKERTGVAELKAELFKLPSVEQGSVRSNPMESAPKTKHHWMHHVSLGLVALAVVTFITLMLLSVFLPPVIPALAVVLPFLPALSPVAAGFAAGGIGAGILLLFAGGMKAADILKQSKQQARERVALEVEDPHNSQMTGLLAGASRQPGDAPKDGPYYAASPIDQWSQDTPVIPPAAPPTRVPSPVSIF